MRWNNKIAKDQLNYKKITEETQVQQKQISRKNSNSKYQRFQKQKSTMEPQIRLKSVQRVKNTQISRSSERNQIEMSKSSILNTNQAKLCFRTIENIIKQINQSMKQIAIKYSKQIKLFDILFQNKLREDVIHFIRYKLSKKQQKKFTSCRKLFQEIQLQQNQLLSTKIKEKKIGLQTQQNFNISKISEYKSKFSHSFENNIFKSNTCKNSSKESDKYDIQGHVNRQIKLSVKDLQKLNNESSNIIRQNSFVNNSDIGYIISKQQAQKINKQQKKYFEKNTKIQQ